MSWCGFEENMPKRREITPLEAARLASQNRARLNLLPSESGEKQLDEPVRSSANEVAKKAPPRVRQPIPRGPILVAPKAELQAHKAAFRELFGGTLSDDFVNEMLAQLDAALSPGHWDSMDPGALNAAVALIASVRPQTELEALIAVQIVATGFAGLKFLQRSQMVLEEPYIQVYGGYANRLLRLQLDLIQALDKHRRGHKQSVQARDVHIHSGAQGVVGIINSGNDGGDGQDGSPTLDSSSQSSSSQSKSEHDAEQAAHAPHPALRSPNADRELVPRAGDAERPMSDARRTVAGSPEGK
jgi:hypothetical protein